ncbi:acyl-CoA dehydrogenase family protein [Saccharopolyspora sp. NPDC050642]|uniref:acyl-CoA dehydrogenase family protein n=1 Tax=Saccharopolyspora sp. NPDC050642 TaxID=3157099 RepID=UPI0033ECD570
MERTVYDESHESFRKVIREFNEKEVVPVFAEWEKAGAVPRDFFRRLGELGVLGFDVPEEYGGPGPTSFKYQAVISEEMARAGVAWGHYGVNTGIVLPYLLRLATEEQKKRWLPGIVSGDLLLSIAMTEPGTGSDLAGIRTVARRDGDEYVIDGAKTFITGATLSELIVTVCRTSPPTPTDRRAGLSLIVVERTREGFDVSRTLDKIGMKASDTCELSYTGVRVPAANLLGEEGQAFRHLTANLPRERLSIGVNATSMATAALRHTLAYVTDRTVFGKPLASFQNTKFVLAECAAEVEAAQALVDKGLELDDAGTLVPADAAKIKLIGTETAGRVIDKCLQLHGGYGYVLEYPIARLYADTRVTRIFGGTSEVMKTIIARSLGL